MDRCKSSGSLGRLEQKQRIPVCMIVQDGVKTDTADTVVVIEAER